ncbi:hypothetical protein [Nocardioides sp. B-3]|uniref:hypothetical protein n=1 Tax=Nocardioides sp. B-3 TaxID=2895565 RepID=UPI003FA5B743
MGGRGPAERAAGEIEDINEHADTVTPQERGRAAVIIAAAKQVAIDIGLEVGTRIFDVTGARATASSVGLDIFWRNIRTHSLHDPIAHKRAEVGRVRPARGDPRAHLGTPEEPCHDDS